MKKAVQTFEQAKAILWQWLNHNLSYEDVYECDTLTFQSCLAHCSCGETRGYMAFVEHVDKAIVVAICEKCGDGETYDYDDDFIEFR